MDDGRLGSRVAVSTLLEQGSHPTTGYTGGDEHASRVRLCGVLLEHRGEALDGVEDGLDVEVHDLAERRVGVGIKGLAPGGAGVREEDVDRIGVLGYLGDKVIDAIDGSRVGGDGVGLGARLEVGKGIESLDGLVAGGSFAGGDEDFGCTGLENTAGRLR